MRTMLPCGDQRFRQREMAGVPALAPVCVAAHSTPIPLMAGTRPTPLPGFSGGAITNEWYMT